MNQGIKYDVPTLRKLVQIPISRLSANWAIAKPRSVSGDSTNDWGVVAMLHIQPEDTHSLCRGQSGVVRTLPSDWPFPADAELEQELKSFDFPGAISLDTAGFVKSPLLEGWALCDTTRNRILLFLHTT